MSSEAAAPPRRPESGAEPRLLLQLIGLQRSGNHAVIDWISSLFERPAHLNNLAHDFCALPENVTGDPALMRADCAMLSFEDARIKLARSEDGGFRRLVDSVVPLDVAALPPGTEGRTIHILRDPYNCWASRVKAREGGGLTSPPELEHFLDNWIAQAERHAAAPESFILYNAWFRSQPYRRAVCARLGGAYSERTLGEVPLEGRGSSFDGAGRPSFRTILKKLDYYRGPEFRRRLLKEPGSYARRLFSRSIDARQLKVDTRFEHLLGRAGARPLFEDATVRRLSREIFGFHVDGEGRMHPATARRRAPDACAPASGADMLATNPGER